MKLVKRKKSKQPLYIYCIVSVISGKIFLEGAKLPLFWNYKVAKARCRCFTNKIMVRMEFNSLQDLARLGKPIISSMLKVKRSNKF